MVLETRRFPKATRSFLRFQMGRTETRRMLWPVYVTERSERGGLTGRLTGHELVEETVEVFHLLGYGETLALAQAMATPPSPESKVLSLKSTDVCTL